MKARIVLMFMLLTLGFPVKSPSQIIPRPASFECGDGAFCIAGAPFYADSGCEAVCQIKDFAEKLSGASGKKSRIIRRPRSGAVCFLTEESLPPEAYSISIKKNGISVRASSRRGFLYAIQSLRQLLPSRIFSASSPCDISPAGTGTESLQDWNIPCAEISDSPRFAYRGVLLDCARHYFTVDQIKEFLDILAIYKVNHFHWHLTDDHAWRLEIKKYPRLTEVGGHNCGALLESDPKVKGEVQYDGIYTQEQAREIVRYADNLGIEVVPEIDMPSHMTAALAAYPDLGCTRGPYEVIRVVGPRGKGLAKDALCPGRDSTFTFVEDVLKEVMEIFPCEYIHVGGDECIKDRWYECPDCKARMEAEGIVSDSLYTSGQYLQTYFINRVRAFVNSRGREIIGWDEIIDGKLDHGATVMSWRGKKTGIEASRRGFDVIMAPVEHCYLDYRQSREIDREPRAFAGTVTLEDVYCFNPTEGLTEEESSHIKGVQGNLWTDVIGIWSQVEYMLLPRLAALSEVQWCSPQRKDFDCFRKSMDSHEQIYKACGYTYARHLWGIAGMED